MNVWMDIWYVCMYECMYGGLQMVLLCGCLPFPDALPHSPKCFQALSLCEWRHCDGSDLQRQRSVALLLPPIVWMLRTCLDALHCLHFYIVYIIIFNTQNCHIFNISKLLRRTYCWFSHIIKLYQWGFPFILTLLLSFVTINCLSCVYFFHSYGLYIAWVSI